MRTAFLLIDAQRNMFEAGSPIHEAAALLARLTRLLEDAREAGAMIAMVRNCGGEGDPDLPGTPGFEIQDELAPRPGELIVDKSHRDAFEDTELGHDLFEAGVGRLIVAGLQSDYCVDATVKRAIDLGFEVVLIADAHSTCASGESSAPEIIAAVNAGLAPDISLVDAAQVQWKSS